MKFNIQVIRLFLYLMALFSLGGPQYVCGTEGKTSQDVGESTVFHTKVMDEGASAINDHHIIVYYFHGEYRCPTCKRIESLTRAAVFDFFSDELNKGLIEFKVINTDEPENKHFVKDYQLFTQSVVVSDMVDGKENQWKILQKIWELVHNEASFKEYVRTEIKETLQ